MTNSSSAEVNYGPNSKNGPVESLHAQEPPLKINGEASRYDHGDGNNDYAQAGDLLYLITDEERQRLVNNIAGGLAQCSAEVQDRMFLHFDQCDPEYGRGVREAVLKSVDTSG